MTVAVYWTAERYAEVLAAAVHGRGHRFSRVGQAMRREWPTVEAAYTPLIDRPCPSIPRVGSRRARRTGAAACGGPGSAEQFAQAWDRVVRVAHEQVDGVLSGSNSAISILGDQVVFDLAPFVELAKRQLVDAGLTVAANIPEVHP